MLRDPSLVPLSHQHQHALALCVQIDRALAAGQSERTFPELAQTVLQHFEAEMRHHFALEEEVLFPRMSAFSATRDLVSELIAEHRMMDGLQETLSRTAERSILADFSRVLRQHVRKEEGVLFEEAQRLLTREQLDEIGTFFARKL